MKRLLLLVLLAAAAALQAQNVTASITGLVKDPSGSVVPNAKITAVNTGTSATFAATSGPAGDYTVRAIPIGLYDLSAEVPGFKKFETKEIRLQVNEIARVDISLEVGQTVETVTVTGTVVNVDTTSTSLRGVVDMKRVADLPLNGRNSTHLIQSIVGVQPDPRADVTSGTTYPGVIPVSVNGGRANTTNYVLDGGQNNDHYSNAPNPMPNPDALQEFSVQTNNFSAEFGRNNGGIVNAVTKSGTNQLHGSAFNYLRNYSVNAANFFAPVLASGSKQDDGLKRNQFGATLGGPAWMPRLYNGRDKTFFFFSYQGSRNRQKPTTVDRVVPTAAQRQGDFSALRTALRNPFDGGTYPGNRIPLAHFSPVTRAIVDNYIPIPDGGGNRIFFATTTPLNDDQMLVRGDHQVSSRNRLTGRFWVSNASTPAFLDPRNYLSQNSGRTWRNTSVVFSDTHTFTPNLVHTALFGFNRTNGNNFQALPAKSLTSLGVKMHNDDKPQYHLTVAGYFQINTGDTNTFLRDEYQVLDTLRWTRGRHQLTFGGEYGRGIGDIRNNFRANGQFGWSSAAPFTGDALADFFVGKFNTLVQGIGEYKDNRFSIVNLFVQDSVRLAPRFTLDLGVRWEPFFPYTDLQGRYSAWRPGQQSQRYTNAPRGILYPGDPGVPAGGHDHTWGNFGPRIGFAWDVFGDGKTSLRAGYGIFFDRSNTISTNSQANQGPFGTIVNVFGNNATSFSDPYAGMRNPFPAPLDPPRDVQFVLPHVGFLFEEHMRNAYMQSWHLTVERQLPAGFVARVSYAASKGTRLVALREINPAIYAPGATTATTNQRRAFAPALGQVTLIEPVGNSTFHSLQWNAERRFSRGFTIRANYMVSKSIDDGSANKSTGQGRTNPFNQAFDKGPSDFDHRHVGSISGVWELPVKLQQPAGQFLLGGWELSGFFSTYSGFPFTVGSGVDNARTGTGGQRADLMGNALLAEGRPRGEQILTWLNPAAFALNTLGTFGNQGRNIWRGPGFATVDLGVAKRFPIRETLSAQFRFEMFNAFNRVNLRGPDGNRSAVNFLRTTSAFDPRILQFAFRLDW